jgi:VanZ family protein
LNSPLRSPAKDTSILHWVRWFLAFGWAALIFFLSVETFGASFTAMLVSAILRLLHFSVSAHTFGILHFMVRKLSHCTEYAIFAIFLYHCFLDSNQTEWRARAAVQAVLVAGLYSLTDEFHQMFVPGRTASLVDCGIDTTGAVLGALIILMWAHLIQPRFARATMVRSDLRQSE